MWNNMLIAALRRGIISGRLDLTLADGRQHSFGPGGPPTVAVRLTDPDVPRKILLNPEVALGEAYMDGHLVIAGDDLKGLMTLVMRSPERFAVDGDLLEFLSVWGHMSALNRGGPLCEARLKGGRLQRCQHAPNGVVRRHTMRQRQHFQQPIFLGRRPGANRLGTIRASDRGANANHDNLTQRVFAIDRTARVRQVPKKLQDRDRIRFFDALHLATLPC